MAKEKKQKENIAGMGKAELDKRWKALVEEVQSLRWKNQGTKSQNVREVRNLKKEIARVLTAINSK